jgi:hypothetical protein
VLITPFPLIVLKMKKSSVLSKVEILSMLIVDTDRLDRLLQKQLQKPVEPTKTLQVFIVWGGINCCYTMLYVLHLFLVRTGVFLRF